MHSRVPRERQHECCSQQAQMSFSKRAAEQELARGSDTEGFVHRWPFWIQRRAYKVISGVTLQPKHHYILEFELYKNHIALKASQQNEKWDKSTM